MTLRRKQNLTVMNEDNILTLEKLNSIAEGFKPSKKYEILISENTPFPHQFTLVNNTIYIVHPAYWSRFLYTELSAEERSQVTRFGSLWGMRIREEKTKSSLMQGEDNE